MKRRLKLYGFIFLSSLLLVSCNNASDVNNEQVPGETTQTDSEGFYLKNDFSNLQRGMKLNLEEYVGYRSDSEENVSFKSYVLTDTSSSSVGYIQNGNGKSNTLMLTGIGEIVLVCEASNGDIATYILEVGESTEFNKIKEALNDIGNNYKLETISRGANGVEVISEIYHSKNYVYDATNKNGQILSSKDDNVYNFTLSAVDSDDLEISVPPVGDKSDFNETYSPLNTFAQSNLWNYTTLTSGNQDYPWLNKYHYMAVYSSSYTPTLFYSLGAGYGTISNGGQTFISYSMLVSLQSDGLYFLPIYATSDLSAYVFTSEIKVSEVDEVNVSSLDEYVSNYEAPEKADTTALQDALKYLTNVMNYTITTTPKVYTEDWEEVAKSSSVFNRVFAGRYKYPKVRKINKDIVFNDNFSGTPGTNVIIPGGLIQIDGKTYRYNSEYNDGNYKLLEEYIEAGNEESFPNWYSYMNMGCYLPTLAFSMTAINNSYAEISQNSEGEDVYHISNSISGNVGIIEGVVAFGYHFNYGSQAPLSNIASSGNAYADFTPHYDDEGNVIGLSIKAGFLYTPYFVDNITDNYWLVFEVEVTDVNSTDLSALKEDLLRQYEEMYQ